MSSTEYFKLACSLSEQLTRMSPRHQYKAVQDLVTDGIRSGYLPDVYVSRLNGLYNRQTGYHNRNNALPAQLLLEQVIAETKKE